MKIAVCGSGFGENSAILEKCKELGREIAMQKHILITGGCKGYPYAAVRGALLEKGSVIAISPAKDKSDHVNEYNFPIDETVEIIYTGKGIPMRNFDLIKESDAVIILDGQTGTLMEFTIAFHSNKKIGILKQGELCKLIPDISKICNKDKEINNIIYSEDPKELVREL